MFFLCLFILKTNYKDKRKEKQQKPPNTTNTTTNTPTTNEQPSIQQQPNDGTTLANVGKFVTIKESVHIIKMQTMFKIAGTVNGKLVLMTQSGIVFKCQVKKKTNFNSL